MKPVSGGIDFGTSNSTVGFVKNGTPQLVPVEGENLTIPSAVFFNFEDNRTWFGRRAIADYTENVEGRLLRALKSVLGTSLINEKTRVKAQNLAFTDIIGSFVGHLKAALDQARDADVEHVVLGRPVHFVDEDEVADRRAESELRSAAEKLGFRHIEFQYEPIAAALDYERSVAREELALIVDIGGGTSDFSIVRVSPERARAHDRRDDILANTGVHVGGTDLDRLASVAHVMPELGMGTLTKDGRRNLPVGTYYDLATWQRINLLYTARALNTLRQIRYEAAEQHKVDRLIDIVENRQGHALAARVESAKIALTDLDDTALEMRLMEETLRVPFTRAGLENAITPPIARITDTITQTLADAGLTPERIDTLFLTGGSTAVPLLRESVLKLFPNAQAVQGDRFGSVGLGLAVDADRKFAG